MNEQTDPRHEARKLAMGSIFCWLFADSDKEECMLLAKDLLEAESADLGLTNNIVEGIKDHNEEINSIIETCAPDWPLDKISKIDLVILRIATYEILFRQETPIKVAIDEAVELAKEFGNDTSSKFVNGVLGTIAETKLNLKEEN